MITISSTPEKTLKTLTGNECIPLSDKTHIKTSALLDLASLINDINTKSDNAMYKKIYDLSSETNITNVLANNDISFENYEIIDNNLYISGLINIQVPHKGKYYITLENCIEKNAGTTLTAGSNIYNISNIIITLLNNISTITLTLSDYISLTSITIAETPMDISEIAEDTAEEVIDTHVSSIDNECLILNL